MGLGTYNHAPHLVYQKLKPPTVAPAQPVTSDIIKVPSKEELEKGAKIQILKPEDVEREQKLEAEKRKKQEQAEKKK